MYLFVSRLHLRSRLAWIAGLTIWLLTAATSLVPERVNENMVERTVSGAEWLADHAMQSPEHRALAEAETDLVSWLLVAGGVFDDDVDDFTRYLGTVGYAFSEASVSEWLKEFRLVLTANEANQRAGELRPMSGIQAELNAFPNPPPDNAEKARQDGLFDELLLSSIAQDARNAAAKAQARIAALQELFERETAQ